MIPRRHGAKRPRRRPWHELREQRRSTIFLLPSLLTTGNLFCGFFAMLLTMDGRYAEAALAIFVAMIMDMLDGRVARLMKATSQFGVEYDSLADVVSFGVAPAILAFTWGLWSLGRLGWAAGFIYVAATAMRLARFNIQATAYDKRYFIGLPIAAGAAVACSLVILLQGEELARWIRVAVAVVTYLVSLLMVSTFRYWSFKEFDWAKRPPVHTLLIVVLAGMIVATKHEVFLFLVFGGYAVSGPIRRLIVGHAPTATPAEAPTRDHP